MIPFDGQFAQNTVFPLTMAADDNTKPPAPYQAGTTAFDIVADANHPAVQAVQAQRRRGRSNKTWA